MPGVGSLNRIMRYEDTIELMLSQLVTAQQLCMFFITGVFVADTAIASVVATRTAATKTTKTTGEQTIMPATRPKTGRPLLNVFV